MDVRSWIFAIVSSLAIMGTALGAPTSQPTPVPIPITVNEKAWPSSPGFHSMHYTARVANRNILLGVDIFLPPAYFQAKEPMPVVMTLHNRGNSGSDGGMRLAFEGLALLMARDDPDTRGTGEAPKHPINIRTQAQFIGLVPQCPEGNDWWSPLVPRILDSFTEAVVKHYKADGDRVYLTGFSYGGSSTWRVAMMLPDRFAAIATLDGRATPDPKHDVEKLKDVAIYQVIGSADDGFIPEAQVMHTALLAIKHPRYVYQVIANGNHWGYACTYDDPEFWKWMFSQRRHGATTTQPSTVPSEISTGGPTTGPSGPESKTILCQYWRDIPGNLVKDLTDDASFPGFPGEQIFLPTMEIPPNQEAGYGSVLRGLIHPPVTGDYTFYIASENQGQLWLAYDENPDHKLQIAGVPEWSLPRKWTQDPHQQSTPIHLIAGKAYYIEARQKSGSGDNHLSVAWKLPDGTMEGPIPGSRISTMAPANVPVAKIVSMDPKELPTKAGTYKIKVEMDYLNHRQTIPLTVILPQSYSTAKQPALVFYADTEVFSDEGPTKDLSGDSALAKWSPLIVIAPQCPAGQTWEKFWVEHATAALVDQILHDFPVDNEKIYLTGSGTGATALWKLVKLLPGKFTAISPICTMEVKDAELPKILEGTEVHIITGVQNGIATDCANRMKDLLANIHPTPDVVFEMQMGSEVAANYYARQDFYQWLLSWHRPAGKAAIKQ